MKKILFILTFLVSLPVVISAQVTATQEDVARIEITPYVDPDLGYNKEVTKQLTNKMTRLLTKHGMAGAPNQRFVLTSIVNVLSEDIIVTTKEMYQYEIEVDFILGDGFEGTKYATNTLSAKGIGETKADAYIAALKKIPVSHSSFEPFFAKGKDEIVNYFAAKCDFILKEASAKADRREYEAAIADLIAIPTVCKECFEKAQDSSIEIYKRMLENECQINISNAKTKMAANQWDEAVAYLAGYTPDLKCYEEANKLIRDIQNHRCSVALGQAQAAWSRRNTNEAAKWLGEVSVDSDCNAEAQKLRNEISSHLDAISKRDWDFKMQENDRQWEFKKQKHDDDVKISQGWIDAIKSIGVAFGKNQKSHTYNTKSW